MELLNSKRDHHDYMCDHTAWGVRVCEEVNSPRIKLLYDIYHMQIMEGDLIATIRQHAKWLGHFHTGGVPGRHELDDTQEVQWAAVMRAIADTGFTGYVAHEFCPHPRPAYLAPRSRSPLRCLATLGICREPTSGSVSHAKTILLLALERRRRNSSNRVVFKLTRASCTYRIAFRSCPF
jgi:hypothetical protein